MTHHDLDMPREALAARETEVRIGDWLRAYPQEPDPARMKEHFFHEVRKELELPDVRSAPDHPPTEDEPGDDGDVDTGDPGASTYQTDSQRSGLAFRDPPGQ